MYACSSQCSKLLSSNPFLLLSENIRPNLNAKNILQRERNPDKVIWLHSENTFMTIHSNLIIAPSILPMNTPRTGATCFHFNMNSLVAFGGHIHDVSFKLNHCSLHSSHEHFPPRPPREQTRPPFMNSMVLDILSCRQTCNKNQKQKPLVGLEPTASRFFMIEV